MNRRLDFRRQSGLSLIELMLAMVLGLIVIAGVTQVFISSKASFVVQENLSRVQNNGRFAIHTLTRELRMAGYAGCRTGNVLINTVNDDDTLAYNFAVGLEGFDDYGSALPAARAAYLEAFFADSTLRPLAGTDVLVVRSQRGSGVTIVNTNNSAQLFASVNGVEPGACPNGAARISGLCEGDILMATDCDGSVVFQAGNLQVTGPAGSQELNITHPASGDPGNALSSWGGAAAPPNLVLQTGDSEILKVGTYAYFVAIPSGGTEPILYRKDTSGTADPLLEGIENLQLLYGEDTNGNMQPDSYVTAASVVNWNAVVSTRIAFLIRSADRVAAGSAGPSSWTLADKSVTTAADGRLRKAFATTVALRNRID